MHSKTFLVWTKISTTFLVIFQAISPLFLALATTNVATAVAEGLTDNTVIETTVTPSLEPTIEPTAVPTVEPTVEPTLEPTLPVTIEPTPQFPLVQCIEDPGFSIIDEAAWVINSASGIAETKEPVKLGFTYVFPLNDKVQVTFKCLPTDAASLSKLKIQQFAANTLDLPEDVVVVGDYAYDITTDMNNGDFKYDLTLPKAEAVTSEIVYIEKDINLAKSVALQDSDLKTISNDNIEQNNQSIKANDIEHFTIFIVTTPGQAPTLSTATLNNQTHVSVDSSEAITVNLTVTTSGSGSADNWRSTEYKIGSGSWQCYDTNNHNGDGTYTESFNIVAPSITGDYDLSLKAYNSGDCSSGGSTEYLMNNAITVVPPLSLPTLPNNPGDDYALSSVSAIWTSINGGSGDTGLNTEEVRWGSPAVSEKSGLRFDATSAQSFNGSNSFLLGMLTHFNWPVYSGTAASSADLQITLNFARPNITPSPTFSYNFAINETSNTSGSCPSWQISTTPCDDMITFPNSYGENSFTIDDVLYTLHIDGFVNTYPDGTPISQFITEEQRNSSAFLVGHLSSVLVEKPDITITKKTNNDDANTAPGPTINVGDAVTWSYIVQNTGNVTLTNIAVTDDKEGLVTCPQTSLASGANMICYKNGTAVAGQYSNEATVTANYSAGTVTDSDPSNYFGLANGYLMVRKVTVPTNDQTSFAINVTGTGTIANGASGSISTFGSHTYEMQPGTYSVTETIPNDWMQTSNTCTNVVVSADETAECTITNTLKTGQLTVIKQVVNNNGGNKQVADFKLYVEGIPVISGAANTFPANTLLTLTEDELFGYQASNWTGDCFANGTITLNPGDNKTCTITNNDIPARLKVIKNVINDEDGKLAAKDFTMNVSGTNVSSTSFAGSEQGVVVTLDAGNYFVTETSEESLYNSSSSIDCSGTIGIGEEKVCTYTNNDKDILPEIEVEKSANVATVDETGGDVTYTFTIRNISTHDAVTIQSLVDDSFTLAVNPNCYVGKILQIGENCTFSQTFNVSGEAGTQNRNWFSAEALDDEGNPTTDSDYEDITFIDVLPSISVSKTSSVNSVPETGANVDFTFTVTNTSGQEAIEIVELTDTEFGTLIGDNDCKVGTILAAGSSCEFTITRWLEGDASGSSHENTFTSKAKDNENNEVSDEESLTVSFSNVPPTIEVTKTANPTIVKETGEDVIFTFVVTNTSTKEAVEITELTDSEFEALVGDNDCKVGTILAAGAYCEFSVTEFIQGNTTDTHTNIFTATVKDNENTILSATDDASVTFSNVTPSIEVTKVANKTEVNETGESVIFTFTVKNTSDIETVWITSLEDSIYGTLSGDADCQNGTALAPGNSCEFSIIRTVSGNFSGNAHTNTFTAHAVDDEQTDTCDDDSATITFKNVLPTIEVTKNSDKTEVNETGESVTFTFTVSNTSAAETVTITSIEDSVYGTLSGDADCQIGTELIAGAICEFTIAQNVAGDFSKDSHTNTFTAKAKDDDGSEAIDSDTAEITYIDVKPTITITKTAAVTSIPEPAGLVTFKVKVTNTSLEKITLESLTDDIYGDLNGQGDCVLPQELEYNEEYTCNFAGLVGPEPGDYTDIVTAIAKDNDGNQDEQSDDATVNVSYVPTLKLVKEVTNDNGGSATAADWTLTATGASKSFSTNGALGTFTEVTPNVSYTMSESSQISGYSDSDWVCDGGSLIGDTITLSAEDDVTCTITNDDIAPKLVLNKIVVNNNGGKANESDWILRAIGSLNEPTNLVGPGAVGSTDVTSDARFKTDTYVLSESQGPDGYLASDWACVINDGSVQYLDEITLQLGDNATCSITNDDIAPKLILNKKVVNDNGGLAKEKDWTLHADGSSPAPTNLEGQGEIGNNDVISGSDFKADTYILSESGGPKGYQASGWSCRVNGGRSIYGDTITINLEDAVVCTITNDDIKPQLVVIKEVINNNGGTLQVNDFPLYVSWWNFIFPQKEWVTSGEINSFNAGSYNVGEIQKYGYQATYSGDCNSDGSIRLKVGDDVKTCIITNDDIQPVLVVKKYVDNDFGGTLESEDFTLHVNGDNVSETFPGSTSGETLGVNAGTYNISEDAVAGYRLNYAGSCNDNGDVTLRVGDVKVCKLFNHDIQPKLKVIKNVINDNGGTKKPYHFLIGVDGKYAFPFLFLGSSSGIPVWLNAGDYEVKELLINDQYAVSYSESCSGSIAIGEEKTCIITNDDVAPKLFVEKEVINDNGGTLEVQDFEFNLTGFHYYQDISSNVTDNTAIVLNVGSYQVSENEIEGYEASEWSGDCSEDGSIDLQLGEVKVCRISNDDIAPRLRVFNFNDVDSNEYPDLGLLDQPVQNNAFQLLGTDNTSYDATEYTDSFGEIEFANILPGDYELNNTLWDNWRYTTISCEDYPQQIIENPRSEFNALSTQMNSRELSLDIGDDILCTYGQQTSELLIQKSKTDAASLEYRIGDSINYQITLTVPAEVSVAGHEEMYNTTDMQDVVLTDIPSHGFTYESGDLPDNEIDGMGRWNLGTLHRDTTTVKEFSYLVGNVVDPGNYKDLAWAEGSIGYEIERDVDFDFFSFSASATIKPIDPTGFEVIDIIALDEPTKTSYFVGTSSDIVADPEEPEQQVVLGVDTIRLPRTGSENMLIAILSILLMGFGVATLVISELLDSKKEKQNKFMKKNLFKLAVFSMTFLLGMLFVGNLNQTFAQDLQTIQIEQPETPTNKSSFEVTYVAYDLSGSELNVYCSIQKLPGGAISSIASSDATANSASCVIPNSAILENGSYEIKAINNVPGGKSASTTVTIDRVSPPTPSNYSKTTPAACVNQISFTTGNDSDATKTVRVDIFRAESTNFTAGPLTFLESIAVGPGENTTSGLYNLPDCNKAYYYAIQAVDGIGNRSGFIGDIGINVVYYITPTPNEGEVDGVDTDTTTGRVDENGNMVNEDGKLIDKDGNLIDENEIVINTDGSAIDEGNVAGVTDNTQSTLNNNILIISIVVGAAILLGLVMLLRKRKSVM